MAADWAQRARTWEVPVRVRIVPADAGLDAWRRRERRGAGGSAPAHEPGAETLACTAAIAVYALLPVGACLLDALARHADVAALARLHGGSLGGDLGGYALELDGPRRLQLPRWATPGLCLSLEAPATGARLPVRLVLARCAPPAGGAPAGVVPADAQLHKEALKQACAVAGLARLPPAAAPPVAEALLARGQARRLPVRVAVTAHALQRIVQQQRGALTGSPAAAAAGAPPPRPTVAGGGGVITRLVVATTRSGAAPAASMTPLLQELLQLQPAPSAARSSGGAACAAPLAALAALLQRPVPLPPPLPPAGRGPSVWDVVEDCMGSWGDDAPPATAAAPRAGAAAEDTTTIIMALLESGALECAADGVPLPPRLLRETRVAELYRALAHEGTGWLQLVLRDSGGSPRPVGTVTTVLYQFRGTVP